MRKAHRVIPTRTLPVAFSGKLHKKHLPVRYDPWDGATVYIQINKRWVAAHCKALIGLGQLTEKERQLITTELTRRSHLREDEEPSQQKLRELMRIFTPEGAAKLDFERQQENRELYEHLGLGAITPHTHQPQLVYPSSASAIDINPVPGPSYTPIASPFIQPGQADDLEFDTF